MSAATEEQTTESAQEVIDRLRREHQEFRAKVRNVSMKYARQHNLCGVVEQALQEAGLNDTKVRLTITAMVPRTIVLELPEDLIVGLNDTETAAKVTEVLTNRKPRAWRSAQVLTDEVGTPEQVTVTRAAPMPVDGGMIRRYFGYDGAKQHLIREADWAEADTTSVYSICGRFAGYTHQWHEHPVGRSSQGVCSYCYSAAQ